MFRFTCLLLIYNVCVLLLYCIILFKKYTEQASEIAQVILFDNIIYDNDMMLVVLFYIGYCCLLDLYSPHQDSLYQQSGLIFLSWLIKWLKIEYILSIPPILEHCFDVICIIVIWWKCCHTFGLNALYGNENDGASGGWVF